MTCIQDLLCPSGMIAFLFIAAHLPRAMGVFDRQGMHAIPAPTGYRTRGNFMTAGYLPSPLHLEYADLAVQEYLGMLRYRLKNRI